MSTSVSEDTELLDWFDTQRENMVERDSYGNPELVCHSWSVSAQRYTIREALKSEREYQRQREEVQIPRKGDVYLPF